MLAWPLTHIDVASKVVISTQNQHRPNDERYWGHAEPKWAPDADKPLSPMTGSPNNREIYIVCTFFVFLRF